jgi:hypothetical protein
VDESSTVVTGIKLIKKWVAAARRRGEGYRGVECERASLMS